MAPDLVVHIGLGASGVLLASALPLLGPALEHAGVPASADGEAVPVGGAPALVVREAAAAVAVDPPDAWAFASIDQLGLEEVLRASGARRARIVFCPQRQDRMLEHAYRRAVADGFAGTLAELVPRRFEVAYAFAPLARALVSLPGVADVRVLPEELIAAGPSAFVVAVLDALDLARPLDTHALDRWEVPREYGSRGTRIAAAMNPHLDDEVERERVRGYVLDNFSVAAGSSPAMFTGERRARVLDTYRAANRTFFAEFAPQFPTSSYSGRAGLRTLEHWLL